MEGDASGPAFAAVEGRTVEVDVEEVILSQDMVQRERVAPAWILPVLLLPESSKLALKRTGRPWVQEISKSL